MVAARRVPEDEAIVQQLREAGGEAMLVKSARGVPASDPSLVCPSPFIAEVKNMHELTGKVSHRSFAILAIRSRASSGRSMPSRALWLITPISCTSLLHPNRHGRSYTTTRWPL